MERVWMWTFRCLEIVKQFKIRFHLFYFTRMFRPTVTIYLYLAELISLFSTLWHSLCRFLSILTMPKTFSPMFKFRETTFLLRKSTVIVLSMRFQYTIAFYTVLFHRYRNFRRNCICVFLFCRECLRELSRCDDCLSLVSVCSLAACER